MDEIYQGSHTTNNTTANPLLIRKKVSRVASLMMFWADTPSATEMTPWSSPTKKAAGSKSVKTLDCHIIY